MKKKIKQKQAYHCSADRVIEEAEYIIRTGDTVRGTAIMFGVCKTTVHRDMTVVLADESPALYKQVAKILKKNKDERAHRGGYATARYWAEKHLITKEQEDGIPF